MKLKDYRENRAKVVNFGKLCSRKLRNTSPLNIQTKPLPSYADI